MRKRIESLLVAFMKCAAYAGGVQTLEAQQFRERRKTLKAFYKTSSRITNEDVKKLFPNIVAAKIAASEMGTSL